MLLLWTFHVQIAGPVIEIDNLVGYLEPRENQ